MKLRSSPASILSCLNITKTPFIPARENLPALFGLASVGSVFSNVLMSTEPAVSKPWLQITGNEVTGYNEIWKKVETGSSEVKLR